jgi:hypothetical protein
MHPSIIQLGHRGNRPVLGSGSPVVDENRMPREGDRFEREGEPPPLEGLVGRPWLGVRFRCAGAYLRVFRAADGTEYRATCPRCARCVRFAVGEGGTNQRFFEVSC